MRHRATRPFLDLAHRAPRALARPIGALAGLGPIRFVASLLAAMVLGTGAFVAVASMGDGSAGPVAGPTPLPDRSGNATSRSDGRPDLPEATTAPQTGSGSATSSSSPAQKPAPQESERTSPTPSAEETEALGSEAEKPGSAPPDASPSSPGTSSTAAEPRPTDRTAPDTSLSARYPAGDAATISFSADEPATFACSLDGAAFTSCTSAATYADLDPGWHTFRVRATDAAGNLDPTPASVRWHANRGPSVND